VSEKHERSSTGGVKAFTANRVVRKRLRVRQPASRLAPCARPFSRRERRRRRAGNLLLQHSTDKVRERDTLLSRKSSQGCLDFRAKLDRDGHRVVPEALNVSMPTASGLDCPIWQRFIRCERQEQRAVGGSAKCVPPWSSARLCLKTEPSSDTNTRRSILGGWRPLAAVTDGIVTPPTVFGRAR